jgi:hypothetical protein
VRGSGGGGIRRQSWDAEPEPEASRSCLVFCLKGQRPVMVATTTRCVAMACQALAYIGAGRGRWPHAAQRDHRCVRH